METAFKRICSDENSEETTNTKRPRICNDCCNDYVKRRFCEVCHENDLSSIKTILAKNAKERNNFVFFSIDIEKLGPRFGNTLISIGFSIADLYSGIISKTRVSIKERSGIDTQDPKTMETFWSKPDNARVLELIRAEGVEHDVAMKWISHYLMDLEAAAKSINAQIQLVTNNLVFDLAHIDFRFCEATGELPMRYSRDGVYLTINDPNERLRALGLYGIATPLTDKLGLQTTHLPDDDAEKMFWQLVISYGATNLFRSGDVTYNQICQKYKDLLVLTNDELKKQLLALARWW